MAAIYQAPSDIAVALNLLAERAERTVVVAGGTNVTPRLRDDPASCDRLVDIEGLHDLRGLKDRGDGRLEIGALTTCAELATSALLGDRAPILVEAARHVGGPQIRQLATIGGNIASRCPRADLVPALLVLDAAVTLRCKAGERRLALEDYLAGANRADELITAVDCEYAQGGTAFQRFAARRSLSPAIVSVAILLRRADHKDHQTRIALGGVAPRALRSRNAERALIEAGGDFSSAIETAANEARRDAEPESDTWASAWYRSEILTVLVRRAIAEADKRLVNA
jgi:aerobic carbon-monoxide dehydrogenase medium subunit